MTYADWLVAGDSDGIERLKLGRRRLTISDVIKVNVKRGEAAVISAETHGIK